MRLRVVFDSTALLGASRGIVVVGAALRYYRVYWSSWLISEFVRKRTEWIANRAIKEGCTLAELRKRQRESRERVDAAVAEMSRLFGLVDYTAAAIVGLDWLPDPNDWPVMQTAVAAQAEVLVTDNARDFPIGEARGGVRMVTTPQFITALYAHHPEAEANIQLFLQGG
ncbi:MAG: hypothetical protein ACR2PL_09295 [Dehalococcoidia bacterium]